MTMPTILRRRWMLFPVAALVLAGCADSATVPPNAARATHSASAHESDGTGNRYFRFLAPLTTTDQPLGAFDGTLHPTVTVHRGTTLVFTSGGSGSERVRVDLAAEQYIVNWKTPKDPGTYRIEVSVGTTLLGYTDVRVAARNSDANAFAAGSTIPVKFRIDQGALTIGLAPVGAEGGSAQAPDGNAHIDIGAGALATEVPI